MIEIKEMNKESYCGQKFTIRYITNGYYDIESTETGFDIKYKALEETKEKS